MEFRKFMEFIKEENMRLMGIYPDASKTEMLLAKSVKITEEVGEFSEQILGYLGFQRKGKEKGSLEDEFADSVITLFLVANQLGIDPESALERKIRKIEERHQKTD